MSAGAERVRFRLGRFIWRLRGYRTFDSTREATEWLKK